MVIWGEATAAVRLWIGYRLAYLLIQESVPGFKDSGHAQKQYVVGDSYYLSATPFFSLWSHHPRSVFESQISNERAPDLCYNTYTCAI